MLLNMHFQKYRSNFENYTYVQWKGSRTKIKHKKRSETLPEIRDKMAVARAH